jgi:hypothetical protein
MRDWKQSVDSAPARRRIRLKTYNALVAAASGFLLAAVIVQVLGLDGRYEYQNPFFDISVLFTVAALIIGYCPWFWRSVPES